MKKKLHLTALTCLFFSQSLFSQNNLLPATFSASAGDNVVPASITAPAPDLEYQNAVLLIEVKELKDAYNELEQKVVNLKTEIERYKKVIDQNNIVPSKEYFTCKNSVHSSVRCGEAFLEQTSPNTFTENTTLTYFVPEGFKEAFLTVVDKNGIPTVKYDITGSGYGQATLIAGDLYYGTYNYFLWVDGTKMDGKKLILTR